MEEPGPQASPGWWDAMLGRFALLLAASLISLALVYPFALAGERRLEGAFLYLTTGFLVAALLSLSIALIPALRWFLARRR